MASTMQRRRRSSNNRRNSVTMIPMLLLLLLTVLVISPVVTGFVAPSVSSSRVATFTTPISTSTSMSTKKHVFFASSTDEASGSDSNSNSNTETTTASSTTKIKKATRNPFKKAYRIYKGYARQLWRETDPSERSRIANDKVAQTVRDMQHVLTSEHETISLSPPSSSSDSNNDDSNINSKKCEEASLQLLKACEHMLSTLEENEKSKIEAAESASTAVAEQQQASPPKKEKKQRSILFGSIMGAAVAAWVFSGNYIFTGLFCLITILGQLEYYRMVMNTGVFPARRISVVGATSMFVTVRFISIPLAMFYFI